MICFPNIKINIGLHLINMRIDGFHTIETVFYPVKFCDVLEIVSSQRSAVSGQKVQFISEGLNIVGEEKDNLVVKAYHLLDKEFDLEPVKIFLYKKIPMGAGLGGGSADAAFAIKLLNEIFDLKLSVEKMKNFASQLGSDCTFFVENAPSYVLGRGNELESFSLDLSKYFIAVIYPKVYSSTADAYKNIQVRGSVDENNSLKKLLQQPIEFWKENIENDFEKRIFLKFPLLSEIKKQLYDCGAIYASMSGSGSAMFGIFENEPVIMGELKKYLIFSGRM